MSRAREEFSWRIEDRAQRLDAWLSRQKTPALSRSAWQKLIRGGHVLVNGSPASPNLKLAPGDRIDCLIPPPEKSELTAEKIPLKVLLEDADLLVIDKPAGMVVHPGAGHREHTLVHALLHHCAGRLSGIGGVERPGLVHRLDADTSGCLVVAKNDAAHRSLAAQFKTRTVEKIYLAWVRGKPSRPSGRIEAPIGRHPVHRQKMAVHLRGRPSTTEWKLRESLSGASLLECRILTGRTHQIRVHCAHIGHPVIGDHVYGRSRTPAGVSRHLLHAWKLTFDHPRTGERIGVTAPVPADFRAFSKSSQADSRR